jgi:hypothetical protein
MLYRVIKEDTCHIRDKMFVTRDGKKVEKPEKYYSILHVGLYKRLLFEDNEIVWLHLIRDGNYDSDSFEYVTGGNFKLLETLYEESEKRLTAINRDKQIDSILE